MSEPILLPNVLSEAFPFYLQCDRDLRIVSAGPSLQLLLGRDITDCALPDVAPPQLENGRVDFDTLKSQHGELIHLQIAGKQDLTLQGQIFGSPDQILFLVSLRADAPAALAKHGITIADYASHDAAMEATFLKHSYETTLDALNKTVQQLEEAVEQNARHAAIESSLTHNLNAAGDIRIRFTPTGEILDLWIANRLFCDSPTDQLVGTRMSASFPDVLRSFSPHDTDLELGARHALSFKINNIESPRNFEAIVVKTLDDNFLLLGQDITERKQLQAKLESAALLDPLTNLGNRRVFKNCASQLSESERPFAILLIDIDDFKSTNDSFGHHAGDALLCTVADRICDSLRENDIAARLGGDEFGILLGGPITETEAHDFSVNLLTSLRKPIYSQSIELRPRMSIGLALSDTDQCVEDVLRDADFAMYTSKRGSDCKVIRCDTKLRDSMRARNSLKIDLQRASSNQEFVPFYQPIIDVQNNRMHAVEALVRWNHPQRGLLTPYHFIELAEELGALGQIGYSIMDIACEEIQALRESFNVPELRLNVNLSPKQTTDPYLIKTTTDILKRTNTATSNLALEITESALIDDFDRAKETFHELRQLGVHVALDDFGVGYSSLNYLQIFPIDKLKIDRSLICEIATNEQQSNMLQCVLQLAHIFNLKVVAEGVETSDQLAAVRDLGCNYVQGYYFAKPMSYQDLLANWDRISNDLVTPPQKNTIATTA